MITINKKDIIWGYIAIIFQMASGIIVLPFVLRMLSSEEVGYNYLMLTVAQMVILFDMGFSPMFSKNISFVFSGAKELLKEGVKECESDDVDYHLLATVIAVAKRMYMRMSIIVLVLMLTGGIAYTWYVTDGYSSVKNSFVVWVIFSISTFFNVYFGYYNSFLTGRGQLAEQRKATICARIAYIAISICLLFTGMGLMSLCIANLISPFISRYMCHRAFFDNELKCSINDKIVTEDENKTTFKIIWHNTKKMCISAVGSYCINKASLFLAGLFLPLAVVGSYGLMIQLGGLIMSVAINYFVTIQPKMTYHRIKGDLTHLREEFSIGIISSLLLMLIGYAFLVFVCPYLLTLIASNTQLPSRTVLLLFALISILEMNHSLCATYITVGNRVPPIASSLIPGIAIVLLSWLSLKFTGLQLLGLIIAQGICQLAYNNWKWPFVALTDLKLTPLSVFLLGSSKIFNRLNNISNYGH